MIYMIFRKANLGDNKGVMRSFKPKDRLYNEHIRQKDKQ